MGFEIDPFHKRPLLLATGLNRRYAYLIDPISKFLVDIQLISPAPGFILKLYRKIELTQVMVISNSG
jgi:hypothetical protein